MSAKLSVEGLGKRYGAAVALKATHLEVRKGELLTLLGPSGSGKTTLLQMISGLVEPSEGRLLIDGRDATWLPPGERGIGMVFQSYALFPHLSVAENVAYPLRMRKAGSAEIAREVARALDMVHMSAFGQRLPRELSGGQQQRVALARCFVYRPEVILLDEPLGALDKNLREHMQLEIRKLHRELGATFIYVTHDQEEALTLSDRICLMNQAQVEQVGTPAEMYDAPASRFAASFIGHSNLLHGTITDGAGPPSLAWCGRQLPLPASAPGSGEATVMVRPENARLVSAEQGTLHGKVREVVFQGSDLKVIVDIGGDQTFGVRTSCQGSRPKADDPIGVVWEAAHSVLLTR
jgi:putative spermidine/putrescine transport system ATP-binding protein